jgi:hypothetical protein
MITLANYRYKCCGKEQYIGREYLFVVELILSLKRTAKAKRVFIHPLSRSRLAKGTCKASVRVDNCRRKTQAAWTLHLKSYSSAKTTAESSCVIVVKDLGKLSFSTNLSIYISLIRISDVAD